MTLPSGKSRAVGNMLVFVACQIDVLNKQLVSPFSWNNPLSETSVGKSLKSDDLQTSKCQG